MTRTAVAAVLALLIALTGCTSDPAPPPAPVVPEELVGAWNVITERGNGFSYEISEKGVYVYVGIMRDQTQQYTLQENGKLVVGGSEVTFQPDSVVITRSDSSIPADNYRSAMPTPPRTLTWAVQGDRLDLTADGRTTTFQRE